MLKTVQDWARANKLLFSLSAGGLILILILGIVTLVLKLNQSHTTPTSTKSSSQSTSLPTYPAPAVKFNSYQISDAAKALKVPDQVKQYLLRAHFSDSDVKAFSRAFGLNDYYLDESGQAVASNVSDVNNQGLMNFDKTTGFFSYRSYGLIQPSASSSGTINAAVSYLSDVGLTDPTIGCNHSYQQTTLPGVTFVECHRQWDKLGLPLVNLPGVLNIPENQTFTATRPGDVAEFSLLDPSIASVSAYGVLKPTDNGKSRPSDFNTVTVGLWGGTNIYSLSSNLRTIISSSVVTNLLTPDEALQAFKDQKAEVSLTLPTGQGSFDFAKAYPNNQALAQTATINKLYLVYLEKPHDQAQTDYSPYYLIQGTANLSSGYTVKFVQVLSAIKK